MFKPLNKRKTWKGKELKKDDAIMENPRENDIFILVMGATGVGKSTFINNVAGQEATSVGHDLQSHTSKIKHVILSHPSDATRRVILVDTPGFDHTYVEDSEILRRIAVWLAKSYSDKMKLGGIVYLHDISKSYMSRTSRKDLDMFNKLCGKEAMKNVILATTKWGNIKTEVGEQHESQLAKQYWKHMLDIGSRMHRLDSPRSAWEVINLILTNAEKPNAVDAVQIQDEMVEGGKILGETAAGSGLRYTLEEAIEIQKRKNEQMRKEDGLQTSIELRARLNDNEKLIQSMAIQVKTLNVPRGRRLKAFLGLEAIEIQKRTAEQTRKESGPQTNKYASASMKEFRKNDIIVLVMGATGAGKSTFINTLAGSSVASVDHGLSSHTSTIEPFIIEYPEDVARHVVMVDTPGFNDTYVEDSEILRRISVWIARINENRLRLAGIVYLYDISQRRMQGMSHNMDMLNKLCSEEMIRNTILVTTMWDDVQEDVGSRRERELGGEWKRTFNSGSVMCRLGRSSESAWGVVDLLANSERGSARTVTVSRD